MESKALKQTRRTSQNLALLASLIIAAAARAGDAPESKLMLTGYADAAAGGALLSGHYQSVIVQLGEHGPLYTQDAVAASTNLCVAYIMTRQWTEAHAACDGAVASARAVRFDPSLWARRMQDEQVAVAYSNRAILHHLEADATSATADITAARTFAPEAEFVSHNLAVLAGAKSAAAPAIVRGAES